MIIWDHRLVFVFILHHAACYFTSSVKIWLSSTMFLNERFQHKTKADKRKKRLFTFYLIFPFLLFCCERLHFFVFLVVASCNVWCFLHVWGLTYTSLCIYAIVEVVTMKVCGFNPEFANLTVMQRADRNKKNIRYFFFLSSCLKSLFLKHVSSFQFWFPCLQLPLVERTCNSRKM